MSHCVVASYMELILWQYNEASTQSEIQSVAQNEATCNSKDGI